MPTVHQTPGKHNLPTYKLRASMARAAPRETDKPPKRTTVFFPLEEGDPAQPPAAPPMRFLKMPEVVLRTGFQKSFLYLRIRHKTFPPPVKIGRSARFLDSEIVAMQRAWAIGRTPEQLRRLVAALISAR